MSEPETRKRCAALTGRLVDCLPSAPHTPRTLVLAGLAAAAVLGWGLKSYVTIDDFGQTAPSLPFLFPDGDLIPDDWFYFSCGHPRGIGPWREDSQKMGCYRYNNLSRFNTMGFIRNDSFCSSQC